MFTGKGAIDRTTARSLREVAAAFPLEVARGATAEAEEGVAEAGTAAAIGVAVVAGSVMRTGAFAGPDMEVNHTTVAPAPVMDDSSVRAEAMGTEAIHKELDQLG